MIPRFDTPRGVICMGTWSTLHPRRILHAPGVITVHGSVSPGESRARDLRSAAECPSILATANHIYTEILKNIISKKCETDYIAVETPSISKSHGTPADDDQYFSRIQLKAFCHYKCYKLFH